MTRFAVTTALALLWGAGGIAPAAGQLPGTLEVVPQVGLWVPTQELGALVRVSERWHLDLAVPDPAPTFGATVRWRQADSPLRVRASVLAAPGTATTGTFGCIGVCPAILLRDAVDVSVLTATAGLEWAPAVFLTSARPYGLVGLGVKRYHVSWEAQRELAPAGDDATSHLALQVGAGVELPLLGGGLQMEVSDQWSRTGDPLGLATQGLSADRVDRGQHDLVFTLGWRFGIF